jgi:hypothetical protein
MYFPRELQPLRPRQNKTPPKKVGMSGFTIVFIILFATLSAVLVGITVSYYYLPLSNGDDKNMILMSNVTDLVNLVVVEEAARRSKDMILMSNVTDLVNLVVVEEAARRSKDMELMETNIELSNNITTLGGQLNSDIIMVSDTLATFIDAMGRVLSRSLTLPSAISITPTVTQIWGPDPDDPASFLPLSIGTPIKFLPDIDQSWVAWDPPTIDTTISHQILENGTYCFAGWLKQITGDSGGYFFIISKVDTNGTPFAQRIVIFSAAFNAAGFETYSFNWDVTAGEYIKYSAYRTAGATGIMEAGTHIWIFKR